MTPISPETRQFINEHQSDDVRNLALQARKYPDVDIPAAITQIAGRQIAAEKIPSWKEIDDIWYPKHLSLEQCSSEITARYKASLLQGESLADLTGGFGIDCSFLATGFRSGYLRRTSGRTLHHSSPQLSRTRPQPYKCQKRRRSSLSGNHVSGRLYLSRPRPPQ